MGNVIKAIEFYERSFLISPTGFGGNTDAASTFYKLGTAHDVKKDYANAIQYYKKALVIRTNLLGHDNPATILVTNALAQVILFFIGIVW